MWENSETTEAIISIMKSLTIIALSVIVYFQRKTINDLENR
jgi:hypothetical protein